MLDLRCEVKEILLALCGFSFALYLTSVKGMYEVSLSFLWHLSTMASLSPLLLLLIAARSTELSLTGGHPACPGV